MKHKPSNIIGLEQFLNSGVIKDVYPMVDKIEVIKSDDFGNMTFKINVNLDKMTEDNMYHLGFDPHYLVDFYIKKYLNFFNMKQNGNLSFKVYKNNDFMMSFTY
jgi:hypothetical protein